MYSHDNTNNLKEFILIWVEVYDYVNKNRIDIYEKFEYKGKILSCCISNDNIDIYRTRDYYDYFYLNFLPRRVKELIHLIKNEYESKHEVNSLEEIRRIDDVEFTLRYQKMPSLSDDENHIIDSFLKKIKS